jgi:hypothetical protein
VKRPSFQFYPGDWSANPNLKRCTFAERGIWLEVMCLMHDQEPYGTLRWPLKEIAQAVGCKPADLQALARKDVLKGSDDTLAEPFIYTPRSGRKDGDPVTLVPVQGGPIWYSSRMVKDEYVRTIRGEGAGNGEGHKPTPKHAPKDSPKPPIGATFGPRGSSSSSSVDTPIPPRGQVKAPAVGLEAWLETVKAKGEKPIPEDDPVFAYASDVGIPDDFLRLAWQEFRHRYTQPEAKRYRDWRSVFRKAVRGNWLKLWFVGGDGAYGLTTVGHQAQRANDHRRTA